MSTTLSSQICDKDIISQALSEKLSEEYGERIAKLKEKTNVKDILGVQPRISPVDLIVLETIHEDNKINNAKELFFKATRKCPSITYALTYSLARLEIIGLIKRTQEGTYIVDDLGEEILERAKELVGEIEKSLSRDSFLSLLIESEKSNKTRTQTPVRDHMEKILPYNIIKI